MDMSKCYCFVVDRTLYRRGGGRDRCLNGVYKQVSSIPNPGSFPLSPALSGYNYYYYYITTPIQQLQCTDRQCLHEQL